MGNPCWSKINKVRLSAAIKGRLVSHFAKGSAATGRKKISSSEGCMVFRSSRDKEIFFVLSTPVKHDVGNVKERIAIRKPIPLLLTCMSCLKSFKGCYEIVLMIMMER